MPALSTCENFVLSFVTDTDSSPIIESRKGMPTKTIHGTSETVNNSVLWYNGIEASAAPKR